MKKILLILSLILLSMAGYTQYTLTASANGSEFSYIGYKNDQIIPDETSRSLTLNITGAHRLPI